MSNIESYQISEEFKSSCKVDFYIHNDIVQIDDTKLAVHFSKLFKNKSKNDINIEGLYSSEKKRTFNPACLTVVTNMNTTAYSSESESVKSTTDPISKSKIMNNEAIFNSPTTSKRVSAESGSSLSVTSPARKKARVKAKTAIGVNTFKDLVEKSSLFIDKSLLIIEFIDNPADVLLITCPRRWGKSINMDMIKTFLEIQVDKYGNSYLDKTQTSNYKLFHGEVNLNLEQENLQLPLNITQHINIINEYQGVYPVIYIDFKNVFGNNYKDIVEQLKLAINKSFKQHEYMINILYKMSINSELGYLEKEKATDHLNKFKIMYTNNGQGAESIDVSDSFIFLSEVLYNHFGKSVFILMDEYDSPINNILQSKQISEEDLESTLTLFKSIMGSTFKGNKHLKKGLITGVFRIARASLFSGVNNIVEYNFLNNQFARYYGFTEDDLRYFFEEYEIGEELQLKAKSWYDGYRVSIDRTLKIYNPWAIVNFLSKKEIGNYWEETGSIDFIKNLFKIDAIKETVQSLISQENIKRISDHPILVNLGDLKFSIDNFLTLKELINKGDNYEIKNDTIHLFLKYIFAAGYLTISKDQTNESFTSVQLPNYEVKSEMEKKLISYYEQVYNIKTELFKNVTDELIKIFKSEEICKLKKSLEELFKAFPEFVNIKQDTGVNGVHGNEDLVHSIINYTALQIKGVNKFGSEVWYKKDGRADIILFNDKENIGMIIELKYEGSADKALTQAQKYLPIFSTHKCIKNIKSLGINVSKNKIVDIKYELNVNKNDSA